VFFQDLSKYSSDRTSHCRRSSSAVNISSLSHLKTMLILFFKAHLGPSKKFFPSKLVKRYYASQYIHTQVHMCSTDMYSTSIPHVHFKKYTDKSKNVVKTVIRISRKSILLENVFCSKT
jgi:hypothetical protein